ncbi:MAG: amidohydrolase family protein [Clostridia bacterium]|nr:amidohydrolase family protein [Clostridia bacterium]
MTIDFHTHCFPDALAPRAMEQLNLNARHANLTAHTDGTAGDLIRSMDEFGIDYSVVCNIATNPRQMHKVNDFAISLLSTHPRLIPLGSLHPEGEELEGEAARLCDSGIKGIKIHPDYIRTHLDSPSFDRIFDICRDAGLFVISHTGYDPISPDHYHATPDMILNVIKRHKGLKFIAAHVGGVGSEEEVLEKLVGEDLYLDTSLVSLRPQKAEIICKIFNNHDHARLLFGTDTPWTQPSEEIEFINRASISDGLREGIFYKNAERLLGKVFE